MEQAVYCFLNDRSPRIIIKQFSTELIYNSSEEENIKIFCPQFFKGFFLLLSLTQLSNFTTSSFLSCFFHILVAGGKKHRWRHSVKRFLQGLQFF